jgi:hypothetical protein
MGDCLASLEMAALGRAARPDPAVDYRGEVAAYKVSCQHMLKSLGCLDLGGWRNGIDDFDNSNSIIFDRCQRVTTGLASLIVYEEQSWE